MLSLLLDICLDDNRLIDGTGSHTLDALERSADIDICVYICAYTHTCLYKCAYTFHTHPSGMLSTFAMDGNEARPLPGPPLPFGHLSWRSLAASIVAFT